ncbi:MAG: ester cyclase [Chloroflexota bacterium]
MSEENKAAVRRFYAQINKGNLGIIDELVADNFVEHDEFPGLTPTKDGVRQLFQLMRAAFPDLQMVAEDMVAEGDKVFVRASMRGTHRGEFMGIPATGRQVNVPMGDFVRLTNGKIVEHWGATDTGMMMQQLGVAGSPS